MKVIVFGGLAESLINFRGVLIKDIIARGHEVITMANHTDDATFHKIEQLGCRFIPISIERNGLSPLRDLKTLLQIWTVFRKERPDVVLAYTIKPVIWGGLAAKCFRHLNFSGLITGLGFAFQGSSFKRKLVSFLVKNLYKLSLFDSKNVIFQNEDNRQTFIDLGITPKDKTHRVNGSGVDIAHFQYHPLPSTKKRIFLTIARLLGEKGIREYMQAAHYVRQRDPQTEFHLVGPEDPSPDGIPLKEITEKHREGDIIYHGATSDVRPFINDCHIFVLASYHEGLPRTVLEAMAIGRPILTTNIPGCKDTVIDGHNGLLVEKANVKALQEGMINLISQQALWQQMASHSRQRVETSFTVESVNRNLISILKL